VNVRSSPATGAFAPVPGENVTMPVDGFTETVPLPAGLTVRTEAASTLRVPTGVLRETSLARTAGEKTIGPAVPAT